MGAFDAVFGGSDDNIAGFLVCVEKVYREGPFWGEEVEGACRNAFLF